MCISFQSIFLEGRYHILYFNVHFLTTSEVVLPLIQETFFFFFFLESTGLDSSPISSFVTLGKSHIFIIPLFSFNF